MDRDTRDWLEMSIFSKLLIIHGIVHYRKRNFDDERIAIVLLDQATELLMKAFLLKKDYTIQEIDSKKIKEGMTERDEIKKILHKEKTINFSTALSIVKRKIHNIEIDKIENFHKLRNKIYHRSTQIIENKKHEIEKFLPALQHFCEEAFEEASPYPTEDEIMDFISRRR